MARRSSESGQAQHGATGRNNILAVPRAIDRFLSSRNDLSERQKTAIECLLRGLSDQETAAQLGVDRGTVFRWRQNIAFARELDRQRKLRSEQAANQLQSMLPSALKILQQQLDSTDPRDRMRAVSVLLRFATPSRLGGTAATAVVTAAGAGTTRPAPHSAEAQARAAEKEHVDDLIDFIEAPLPGEPGAPETMGDELDDEDEDEEDCVDT